MLDRALADQVLYPAVDPLASSSRILDPRIVGDEHYDVAQQVQQILQRYRDLREIIAILGIDELSDEDRIVVARARASSYSSHSLYSGRSIHRRTRRIRKDRDTIRGFKELVEAYTTTCRTGILHGRTN